MFVYTKFVVDTGSQLTISRLELSPLIIQAMASCALVQGCHASKLNSASLQGEVYAYFMSLTPTTMGSLETLHIHTMGDLSCQLLSITMFYRDKGYSIYLRHWTDGDGRCEIVAGNRSIPLMYDPRLDFFMAHVIISKDKHTAIRNGRQLELKLQNTFNSPRAYSKSFTVDDLERACIAVDRKVARLARRELQDISMETTQTWYGANSVVTEKIHRALGSTKTKAEATMPCAIVPIKELLDTHARVFSDYESVVMGVKRTMHPREVKLTEQRFHEIMGHLGNGHGCHVCERLKGSFVRIYRNPTHHTSTLPGFEWVMDLIYWLDIISPSGALYSICIRDKCTGAYAQGIHLSKRSNAAKEVSTLIGSMRKDPLYTDLSYPIIQILELDAAGEWSERNKEFLLSVLDEYGIRRRDTVSGDHRTTAHLDAAIKQAEITTKSILCQSKLPTVWTSFAYDQMVQLRNRFPRSGHVARDGTGDAPLTELSCGRYSQEMCKHFLHYTLPVGTPAFVFDAKVKGSNINKTKCVWGVVLRQRSMDGALVFMNPFIGFGSQRASKNYRAIELDEHSYYEIIGLPCPVSMSGAARIRSQDVSTRSFIQLQDYHATDAKQKIARVVKRITSVGASRGPTLEVLDADGHILTHNQEGELISTYTTRARPELEPKVETSRRMGKAPT